LDGPEEKSIITASNTRKKKISGPTGPAGDIRAVTASSWAEMSTANACGTLILARSVQDLLEAGNAPKIINHSSDAGSIIRNLGGGWYDYGGSKAGLNFFTRALAAKARTKGIIVIAVHPGWVQTDMGGKQAVLTPADSVRRIISVIDRLKKGDTSKFYAYDGSEYSW
jgi:NAD(P)-dependent dehydrogenase (short-subunit alcohol dehydrogenase family)